MATDTLLPIKIVFRQDDDYSRRGPTPVSREILRPVTPELRNALSTQVDEVRRYFTKSFGQWPDVPAIARVQLIPRAVAKSHRPRHLFNRDTCPVVGGGHLGELLVSVTPRRLDELQRRILEGETIDALASISALERIDPYTSDEALGDVSARKLSRNPLRLRVFKHRTEVENNAVINALITLLREAGVEEVEELSYARSLKVFRLRDVPPSVIERVARFVGTQSLGSFPHYHVVRTTSHALSKATRTNFPPPDPRREYGLVGVIDTGTDPTNPHLQAWVAIRDEKYVPTRSLQNNNHGSFVAGLIIHSRSLNHENPRFPDVASRIVDIVALDKSGQIYEDDLRQIIEECCRDYPQVRVWNLSLGLDNVPCVDKEFSLFAAFLDEMAQKHGVQFVIAAGNYEVEPLRDWPPSTKLGESDRLCAPADAARGITVGSIAHVANQNSRVRVDEPSPFSRRGPGAAYLMKPDLVHCAGNCDAGGASSQSGVVSVDGSGHIAESIGTSFATPIISSMVANVWQELVTAGFNPSPTLVKGLLLHAAHVRNRALDAELIKYVGVGLPPDVPQIINCTQSSATLIFNIQLQTSPRFNRRPFPMPKCLFVPESGLQAEVFMTLAYDPPMDRRFGVEYCRRNVTASLGTVKEGVEDEDEAHVIQVKPVPKDIGKAWEKDLVKNGFKWSPVKFYHRVFSRGQIDKTWQLKLDLLERAGFPSGPDQDVALFITIRDPNGTAPVYNELLQEMSRLNWITQDLPIQSRERGRA